MSKNDAEAALSGQIEVQEPDAAHRPCETRSLRRKLVRLIIAIVVACLIIAILTVLILIFRFIISRYFVEERSFTTGDFQYFLNFLFIGFLLFLKAVPWGLPLAAFLIVLLTKTKPERHTYESLARYLQLQLTVVIVFLATAFLGNTGVQENPIKIIQISLVDLVLAVLFAIAYSFEPSTAVVPEGSIKNAFITRRTLKNFVLQGAYQAVIIAFLTFGGERIFGIPSGRWSSLHSPPTQHFTIVFNVFVLMTLFNAINSRKIYGERNVFQGVHKNIVFIVAWIAAFVAQVLIVQFGGNLFWTAPLTIVQWIWSIAFGLCVLLWEQLIITC